MNINQILLKSNNIKLDIKQSILDTKLKNSLYNSIVIDNVNNHSNINNINNDYKNSSTSIKEYYDMGSLIKDTSKKRSKSNYFEIQLEDKENKRKYEEKRRNFYKSKNYSEISLKIKENIMKKNDINERIISKRRERLSKESSINFNSIYNKETIDTRSGSLIYNNNTIIQKNIEENKNSSLNKYMKTNSIQEETKDLLYNLNINKLEETFFAFNKTKDERKLNQMAKCLRQSFINSESHPFFDVFENKINFLNDGHLFPNLKSKLVNDDSKVDNLTFLNRIKKIQHPNIINHSTLNQINKLRKVKQSKKDKEDKEKMILIEEEIGKNVLSFNETLKKTIEQNKKCLFDKENKNEENMYYFKYKLELYDKIYIRDDIYSLIK